MDVYDVNEDLVKALVKLKKIEIISEKFINIPTNHGRVNYVEELLVKYQQFSKLDLKINPRLNKNDEKSLNFRKEGNECFSLKNKDYHKALELYNKSICFSTKDSENQSIGYANRSAILFEWKRYRECLENIKLAKKSNYPERLKHKIEKREKDCLEFLQQEQQQDEDPKSYNFELSYNQHPVVPFIADCLDIKTSDECGRYIYTKKDLNPGDLVAIEEPFCSILLPSLKYKRCANCKKENFYTLIPCENCTSAMFCNEKCLKEGYENFHKYECTIIDLLFELFTKIHLIGLRVTLTTINIFSNIEECIKFCKNDKNFNQNSFTLNYKNFTIKEHYRAIHGLVTNQEKRHIADLFQRSVITAILKRYILKYCKLIQEILNNNDKINFFIDLLYQHLQISSSNFHSIDLIDNKNIIYEQSYACGAYAFGSLLNHSCAPNIVRIYNGINVLIFILRPIKNNNILYDNYGYHYATHSKRIRQQNLDIQYKFICNCEACKNDYKIYNELSKPKNCPEGITQNDIENLLKYNYYFALENYKKYCDYLKNYHDKYFPCVQISAVEESLKMALNILVDAIPLKLKY